LGDVLGGVVEDPVLEALGEVAAQAVHLGLDPIGDLERVGAGCGVDRDGDGRGAVELGEPLVALGAELDPGHVLDPDQLPLLAPLDDDVLELLGGLEPAEGVDGVLERLVVGRRLTADLARRHLDVLLRRAR
jgi:hypothetical protein